MVLSSEGRIFVWGRGSFGRLGSGTEKDHYSPVEVFLPGMHSSHNAPARLACSGQEAAFCILTLLSGCRKKRTCPASHPCPYVTACLACSVRALTMPCSKAGGAQQGA